jgi:hypothetical protein
MAGHLFIFYLQFFLSGLNFPFTLGTSVACVHTSEGMDKLQGYGKTFYQTDVTEAYPLFLQLNILNL